MTEIVFATGNPHKVREATEILAPFGIDIVDLRALGRDLPEPVEDGETFEDNARLKARYYAKALGVTCLAEDSGLEVDALGGAPGVYSARYSDSTGTREERDHANNDKLLAALAAVPADQRQARFVCALAVADASGNILAEARGTYPGVIAFEPHGAGGFGYDPLLYLADRGCTSAELPEADKNARSHRGQALRQLLDSAAFRSLFG